MGEHKGHGRKVKLKLKLKGLLTKGLSDGT